MYLHHFHTTYFLVVDHVKENSLLTATDSDTSYHGAELLFRAVQGSKHQGSDSFSDISRGRQCVCNAAVALTALPSLSSCSSDDIDEILFIGDLIYKGLMSNDEGNSCGLLEVNDLPNFISFRNNVYNIELVGLGYYGMCISNHNREVLSIKEAINKCFTNTRKSIRFF